MLLCLLLALKLDNCPTGLSWVRYYDEISFVNEAERKIIDQVDGSSFNYGYNSIKVIGSFCPTVSGTYRIRQHGRPYTLLMVGDQRNPQDIGPAGSCWASLNTDTSITMDMKANFCYPVQVLLRTGCTLYPQNLWLGAYLKDGDQEIEVPLNLTNMLSCTWDQCVPGHFNENCTGVCQKCPPNMVCNDGDLGDGSCICPPDATDCFCSKDNQCNGGTCVDGHCQCAANYYGNNCERYCNEKTTCHGRGTCSAAGTCQCQEGYYGYNCETQCTREDMCHGHGECNNGVCTCDAGYEGNTCQRHPYQPSPNETAQGVILTQYHNEFFGGGFSVPPTVKDQANFDFDHLLYESATVVGSVVTKDKTRIQLMMSAKPFGQIHANKHTLPDELGPGGSCLDGMIVKESVGEFTVYPNKLYPFSFRYRSGCSLWSQNLRLYWKVGDSEEWTVVPQENLRATDTQSCLKRYSGLLCDEYCDADCNMNGDCVLADGKSTCQCFEGYFGDHCENKCDPQTTCNGHGRCGYNGTCICDAFHSGEHCEIGCGENTCSGHGVCDGDSACKCNDGWEGPTCAMHTYMPSPNEAPKGVNYTLYNDEYFRTAKEGPLTANNVSYEFTDKLVFQSVSVTGSFFVPKKVSGVIRVNAKPHGQLIIGDETVPAELGPALSCWGTTHTYAETSLMSFVPNKLYNFTYKYRSGCNFIHQYMKLEWKLGATQDWSPIPPEYLRINKPDQQCVDRYSGDNCADYCDADCNMNGDCVIEDGAAKCKCFEGFSGDHCETGNDTNSRFTKPLAVSAMSAGLVVALIGLINMK